MEPNPTAADLLAEIAKQTKRPGLTRLRPDAAAAVLIRTLQPHQREQYVAELCRLLGVYLLPAGIQGAVYRLLGAKTEDQLAALLTTYALRPAKRTLTDVQEGETVLYHGHRGTDPIAIKSATAKSLTLENGQVFSRETGRLKRSYAKPYPWIQVSE